MDESLERWGRGWLGPVLAALIALLAGLPGLIALPPLDRDESRFAQASAQMLETADFVSPRFQEEPRFRTPAGIYWLQAACVKILGHVEDRQIWAYRLPSILGAMLAAAACAWGAAAFLSPGASLVAGALLGCTALLSSEAAIAATDGALCGVVTLSLAALGRLYLAANGGPPAGRRVRALFWVGMATAMLIKGPIGPMIVALTLTTLAIWDRKIRWMKDLGWGWGAILILAVIGPWALAITVASDGAVWGAAFGAEHGRGGPPGLDLAAAPLLLFPASLLLPAAAETGWRGRMEPGVRFALAWLIPAWIVFDLIPTKAPHDPLPLFGAIAWLMARAMGGRLGLIARVAGVALVVIAAIAFAVVGPVAAVKLGAGGSMPIALAGAVLFLGSGLLGSWWIWRGETSRSVLLAGALAIAAHGILLGAVAPSLGPLWLSSRAAGALAAAGASPRQGVIPGPVTVAGYEEPSMVFLLGTETELGDADDAAAAIADGRPAIVEDRLLPAFETALAQQGVAARRAGAGAGLDYSNGRHDVLRIFLPAPDKDPG